MKIQLKEKMTAVEKLRQARLYCITLPTGSGQTLSTMVDQACKGGADIIQFREKKLSTEELVALGRRLQEICRSYDKLFIVNDRMDVALACNADGVHLGQDDLPVTEAMRIRKDLSLRDEKMDVRQFLIGCSTHSLDQALKAQSDGADYVGCGPVFATPTKPNAPAVGLSLVREYRQHLQIPFCAIGGIDYSNVGDVLKAGARCVAVVRAAFAGDTVETSVRSLKNLIADSIRS